VPALRWQWPDFLKLVTNLPQCALDERHMIPWVCLHIPTQDITLYINFFFYCSLNDDSHVSPFFKEICGRIKSRKQCIVFITYVPLLMRFSSGNSGNPVTCRLLVGGAAAEPCAFRVNLICCFCPDSCKKLYQVKLRASLRGFKQLSSYIYIPSMHPLPSPSRTVLMLIFPSHLLQFS
jgi:hypothetical protein